MNDNDRQKYLEFAKKLALEAGEIMRKYFLATETTWKGDNTPLTQADTEINRLVIERINTAYPGHSILGEEESDMKEGVFVWVCDPVDGTMPYSHGLPISTFSLALCEDGVPQVGVVYDPFMKRLFWANVGSGAFCNDERLYVNDTTMQSALIDISAFPSTNPVSSANSMIMTDAYSAGARVTSLWSCILPSCMVAQGLYEAVVLNIPSPHDPAAIKVIVEEAGGRVTDLFGNNQRYDQPTRGFIASNGVIHDELVQLVKGASK